jgi:hypothetical protein
MKGIAMLLENGMKTLQKTGRPTKITVDIETKLESILKIGGTIAEATAYAGIGERTYYDRAKASEEFSQKMEAAKHYADIVAKNVVVDDIVKNKGLDTAKWWLEKRQFRNDPNVAVQVNVTPIVEMKAE